MAGWEGGSGRRNIALLSPPLLFPSPVPLSCSPLFCPPGCLFSGLPAVATSLKRLISCSRPGWRSVPPPDSFAGQGGLCPRAPLPSPAPATKPPGCAATQKEAALREPCPARRTTPSLTHTLYIHTRTRPPNLLKPMLMSFLGLSERCQYWHSAAGLGSTTPAVYTAWRGGAGGEGERRGQGRAGAAGFGGVQKTL